MSYVTINKAAALAGLSIKTLRYYDRIGLCPPTARTPTGYRLYSQEAINTLQQIQCYRKLKFSIQEIRILLASPPDIVKEALLNQYNTISDKLKEYQSAEKLLHKLMNTYYGCTKDNFFVNRAAIIAIDLQNDILEGGALPCKRIQNILPRLAQLFSWARDKHVPVIYLCDCHQKGDPELDLWNDHMMKGTWGCQIINDVAPQKTDYVIQKNLFNGFIDTGLQSLLASLDIQSLIIVGWRTHVCVAQTAIEAFHRGYRVIIAEDGVDSTTRNEHEHGISLLEINYGFELYSCQNIMDSVTIFE